MTTQTPAFDSAQAPAHDFSQAPAHGFAQAPKLRFPEFSDDWKVKKLGDLLEFKNGINADKEQYGSGAKFINVLDILNNDYITHDKIIGSVNVDNQTLEKYLVSYGDILFQRSSETREEVGTANVYLDEKRTATFGGFVIRGKKIGEYNPVFLNKLLKTDSARDNITSKSGGSTRYNVGQEILSSVGLLFPQLPEQTKIANFLTAIDEKIQALKQKKTLLEQYKKGIMQGLFCLNGDSCDLYDENDFDNHSNQKNHTKSKFRQLRFKNDDGADFDDWEEKSLGEIGTFYSGGTPLTTKREFFGGEIPFIRSGEINSDNTEQFITELGLKNSSAKKVEIGDILYAMYGATSGEVAISKISGAINQAVLCIRTTELNHFIYYYLQLEKEKILKTYLQGGQGNLSAEIIKSLSIPVPSLPEQQKIANFLTAIDEKIEKVSQQIEATETYKKGLLQQMFC